MKKSTVLTVLAALLGLLALGLFVSCGERLSETPTTPQSSTTFSSLLAPSCEGATASTPISNGGITPYIIPGANPGGNRTCDEVASCFGTSYDNSSARFSDGAQCSGTVGPITWSTTDNCTYVCWESSVPVKVAVIVKGGDDANVYVYEECTSSDCGLASPPNESGNPAGLSNITFCWTECEQEECFEDETAWGAGTRYVSKGNWATYTSYSGVAKSVTLFAGQTLNAGTVAFSAPSGGQVTITITLNAGWRFDPDTDESVKIQDYASPPPAVNPAPGLFAHKGDAESSPFSITVPQNNFYGVHVDVERQVDCP